jgi:hypothetical protein
MPKTKINSHNYNIFEITLISHFNGKNCLQNLSHNLPMKYKHTVSFTLCFQYTYEVFKLKSSRKRYILHLNLRPTYDLYLKI